MCQGMVNMWSVLNDREENAAYRVLVLLTKVCPKTRLDGWGTCFGSVVLVIWTSEGYTNALWI